MSSRQSGGAGTQGAVRAVRCIGLDRHEIVEMATPVAGPGMALAAPAFVGLCGTDLDLFDGSMPYFRDGTASHPLQPGHEWSGTLLEPTPTLQAGTRVILDPMVACGRVSCKPCGSGYVVRCPDRMEFGVRNGLDGALATVAAVPSANVIPIPDGVDLRDAALAEPMVTMLEGIRRTAPTPEDDVLIVGAGTLGLAGVMLLRARGVGAYVLIRSDERAATIEAAGGRPWLTGTSAAMERFDVVIEAAGTPDGVRAALSHAAPGARVALLGVPTVPVEVDTAALVVNDVTIFGILNGPGQFGAALAALADGHVDADLLIDAVFGFDEIGAALARARQPGRERPKVMVTMGAGAIAAG